jgi:hypothetical protein
MELLWQAHTFLVANSTNQMECQGIQKKYFHTNCANCANSKQYCPIIISVDEISIKKN